MSTQHPRGREVQEEKFQYRLGLVSEQQNKKNRKMFVRFRLIFDQCTVLNEKVETGRTNVIWVSHNSGRGCVRGARVLMNLLDWR